MSDESLCDKEVKKLSLGSRISFNPMGESTSPICILHKVRKRFPTFQKSAQKFPNFSAQTCMSLRRTQPQFLRRWFPKNERTGWRATGNLACPFHKQLLSEQARVRRAFAKLTKTRQLACCVSCCVWSRQNTHAALA